MIARRNVMGGLKIDADKGFTLLEIMIALAVIGGLLLTLIGTVNYMLDVAGRHEVITVASMLAKDKLYQTEKSPSNSQGAFPEPYIDYSYKTELKDSIYPGLKELTVTVKSGKEAVTLKELIGHVSL